MAPFDLSSPPIRLTKHQALGNDFLVLLDETNERAVRVGPELARYLCHRTLGVGADGLIHGTRASGGETGVDVVMHLFNADGSRAEMSGNGVRCLAQALMMARRSTDPLVVRTDAGLRCLEWVDGADHLRSGTWSVEMGCPAPGPDVPAAAAELVGAVAPGARFATVDMGNPHLVVEVSDLRGLDVAGVGAALEHHFRDGINVEFVHHDATDGHDPDLLELRVWERGAGITEACGTGACAAAVTARRWGLVSSDVQVGMPGGPARVVLRDDDQVLLTGPASHIADLEVPGA